MARGLPISLWRYVLFELWRLILLSTFVLVAVISFVAAIKPLADGKLAPLETLKFMGLAVIPMLQWALPFAAGFGATLAYHRMTHDNELTGAHAGGISHRVILGPAAISGLILAAVLLLLCQQVIPRFLRSMEQLIAVDVTKMLFNSIQRGQAAQIPGSRRVIHADRVVRLDPAPGSGARDELALWGVAALELDKEGNVIFDAVAATARIWIFSGDSGATENSRDTTVVSVRLRDVVYKDRTGVLVRAEELPFTIPASGGLRDNPKFLPAGELDALHQFPERADFIEIFRRDLAVRLGEKALPDALNRTLHDTGSITLMDEDRPIVVYGSGLTRGEGGRLNILPLHPGEPVELDVTRPDPEPGRPAVVSRVVAKGGAALYTDVGPGRADRRLTLRLELENATTRARIGPDGVPEPAPAGELSRLAFQGLTPSPDPTAALLDPVASPSRALLSLAAGAPDDSASGVALAGAAKDLSDRLGELDREVTSKQQERWAISAACLVMVVSGAVTAVTLSHLLPLTVYLWSFFPALAAVITINSGQQLTHGKGPVGLIVLWGGVAVLGLYALIGYWRLARH